MGLLSPSNLLEKLSQKNSCVFLACHVLLLSKVAKYLHYIDNHWQEVIACITSMFHVFLIIIESLRVSPYLDWLDWLEVSCSRYCSGFLNQSHQMSHGYFGTLLTNIFNERKVLNKEIWTSLSLFPWCSFLLGQDFLFNFCFLIELVEIIDDDWYWQRNAENPTDGTSYTILKFDNSNKS